MEAIKEILGLLNQKEGAQITNEHEQWEHGFKVLYKTTRLTELTQEQFDIILPFLSQRISEDIFSKHKVRLLARNRIYFIWQIFDQDWKYFPDREISMYELLTQFEKVIGFILEFRICFTKEQKEILHRIT